MMGKEVVRHERKQLVTEMGIGERLEQGLAPSHLLLPLLLSLSLPLAHNTVITVMQAVYGNNQGHNAYKMSQL